MLVNRLVERLRRLGLRTRLLRERARLVRARRPVILVPSVLGTRLLDGRGGVVWGSTRRLFRGPPIAGAAARPAGLLDGFALLPGLVTYDIYGGLVRFLEAVGGYRRGEDLHVLDYDWRCGSDAAAEALAAVVDRVRGIGDEQVDLVAVSTGGLAVRQFLASAHAGSGGGGGVRRAIYIGTPLAGSVSALVHLAEGVQLMPGGRRFEASEIAACQTIWEALPRPEERVFVDAEGAPLDLDLYDAATWRHLALAPAPGLPDLAQRLARARRTHEVGAAGASASVEPFAIGANNLPTAVRCTVEDGRARLPPCEPRRGNPRARFLYEAGDDTVALRSLSALPGFPRDNVWSVKVRGHRLLPSAPDVHRLVLEALLATDRRIPETSLARSPARSLPVVERA